MDKFILAGVHQETSFRFVLGPGRHVVGRNEDCDVVIRDGTVSRHHAEVTVEGDQVRVRDLGSLNKTFVNEMPVARKTRLALRDRVRFGQITLTLLEPQSTPATPLTTEDTAFDSFTTSLREIRERAGESRSERILSAMAEAGTMLSRSLSSSELYRSFFDLLDRLIVSSRILVLEQTEEPPGYRVLASRIHDSAPEEALQISSAMLRDILVNSQAVLTADAASDRKWRAQESIQGMGVHAAMGAPLFDNDRVLGAIYLDSRARGVSYDSQDLQLLTILANMVAVKITNGRLEEKQRDLARLRHELATAAGIQRNLLPGTIPALEGYRIFAHIDPSEEIGGDLYDVRRCRDGRLWLAVGDVTGHGITAAILMSHTMAGLQVLEDACTDPLEMVTRLDEYLHQQLELGQFVTMFVGLLDPASGRLDYVNAGHPPPLVLSGSGAESLASTGPPVALLPGMANRTRGTCTIEAGSTLLVYSDGVSEIDRGGAFYGDGPMQAYLGHAGESDPEALVRGLLEDARKFGGDLPAGDDLALVAVKRQR